MHVLSITQLVAAGGENKSLGWEEHNLAASIAEAGSESGGGKGWKTMGQQELAELGERWMLLP